MIRISFLLILPLLMNCSENADKSRKSDASIKVTSEITNEKFGGVGFHVIYHTRKPTQWRYEQVFAKRWRELNPAFARVTDSPRWGKKEIDETFQYLEVMKNTNTEIYLTSFGVSSINEYKNELDYVKKEVDNIQYLIQNKGFENINYYCMTNELSVEEWASMVKNNELDRFKRIHQLFYDELKGRDLEVKLLATDASPFVYWPTIEWAAENMDEITGVYGGHHYINSYDLDDPSFYNFFLDKMKWGANLAKSKGKKFIMGEFGPKQGSIFIDSVFYDGLIYNNTPLEPYVGIQIAEAIMAQINGGIYASSYWTFCDIPGIPPSREFGYRVNKWGVFKWYFDDHTTRPTYYALGLLTRFFRGPAEVYNVNSTDSLLRVSAIKNLENGSHSIAVINRHRQQQPVDLSFENVQNEKAFRKYVYDPENIPFNYFGDMQSYSKKLSLKDDHFTDSVPGYSLVVYTTNYDDQSPAKVEGLQVSKQEVDKRDANVLTWDANMENDFCYYRIYRSINVEVEIVPRNQIASTVSTEHADKRIRNLPPYYYKVIAVDKSGNCSN